MQCLMVFTDGCRDEDVERKDKILDIMILHFGGILLGAGAGPAGCSL